MSAEIRTLVLPSGQLVTTPLLVPSFSSRGFGVVKRPNQPERSEISGLLDFFADRLSGSFLVSAYDLHHCLLEAGERLDDPDWTSSLLSRPEVLFIDCGGYEVRQGVDAGELVQDLREPNSWSEDMYGELLGRLPQSAFNCAVVAWDRPGEAYETQVEAAREFLEDRPGFAPVILLKPRRAAHTLADLEPAASSLAFFSVVGVTEHELGTSLCDRLIAIMDLRDILSRANLATPIHIFGALDPLFVPLYFAAGADVFDGLTWLRYAYWHGLAVHREQAPLLDGFLEQPDDVRRYRVLDDNLSFLRHLQTVLRRFAIDGGDWTAFDDPMLGRPGKRTGDILQSAYLSAMETRCHGR